MQLVSVVVVRDNVVESVDVIVATDQGIVTGGRFGGKSVTTSAETLFYEKCRKVDPSLPENMLSDEDDVPENYPDFDGGIFEHIVTEYGDGVFGEYPRYSVCLHHPHIC